jgi:hypothetical protein
LVLTLVGMSREEYFRGPFWVTLSRASGANPLILSVGERSRDHAKLGTKHGEFFQFLLLNEDAVMACNAAQIKLSPLGSIAYDDLIDEPSVLLGARPARST